MRFFRFRPDIIIIIIIIITFIIIIIIITFIKYMKQVKNISHTKMDYLNLEKKLNWWKLINTSTINFI